MSYEWEEIRKGDYYPPWDFETEVMLLYDAMEGSIILFDHGTIWFPSCIDGDYTHYMIIRRPNA